MASVGYIYVGDISCQLVKSLCSYNDCATSTQDMQFYTKQLVSYPASLSTYRYFIMGGMILTHASLSCTYQLQLYSQLFELLIVIASYCSYLLAIASYVFQLLTIISYLLQLAIATIPTIQLANSAIDFSMSNYSQCKKFVELISLDATFDENILPIKFL